MQRNLDKALFFIQSGLVDSKLINIRNEGAKIKIPPYIIFESYTITFPILLSILIF